MPTVYSKTVWSTGDIISAVKMNNLETQFDDVVGAGTVLTAPELKNYIEPFNSASISSGVLTLDLSLGSEFTVSLNANITSITFSNYPSSTKVTTVTIRFTADGTVRTITWPSSFKWAAAAPPTMTGTNLKVDTITARTYDGGTTWYPAVYTQNA